MSREWGTHEIRFAGQEVIKGYRAWDDGQPRHEWRALRLLHAHAPGLAPVPLRADLDARPPSVTMSRLPGEPLRGGTVTPGQTAALAAAVRTVWESVPAQAAAALPLRRWHEAAAAAAVHRWNARRTPAAADPGVARAMDEGVAWLAAAPDTAEGLSPVLGPGDGNLANYLWDGARVRIVDFEDAGRSDRPFELAEITEHVSAWVDTAFDAEAFLGRLVPALTARERVRLLHCRRLISLVWLFLLAHEDPAHPRNPPGTLRRQAGRVRELLGRDPVSRRPSRP